MENLETRLNEVARIAVRLEQETGCPPQLLPSCGVPLTLRQGASSVSDRGRWSGSRPLPHTAEPKTAAASTGRSLVVRSGYGNTR